MDARNQPVVQLEIFQPKQDKENQKRRMLVSPLLREQTLTLDKDDTDSFRFPCVAKDIIILTALPW